MTPEQFATLCGPTLYHVSAATNAQSIAARGLLSAAALARQAGQPPQAIALRSDRVRLKDGTLLNHQKPLLKGRKRAAEFLDGHTLLSWAMQLDDRVFLAPARKLAALLGSFEVATTVLSLDSADLHRHFADHLFLCPINSGNADRAPRPRGDWIYTAATSAPDSFHNARRARGLVKGRDVVKEISLTRAIAPAILQSLLT